jgi:hypothetical protein
MAYQSCPLLKVDLPWEKALGSEHLRVANSPNNLASLYNNQGRNADAEALYKRALAIREKKLGLVHPDLAGTLSNLAIIYGRQGATSRLRRFKSEAWP